MYEAPPFNGEAAAAAAAVAVAVNTHKTEQVTGVSWLCLDRH